MISEKLKLDFKNAPNLSESNKEDIKKVSDYILNEFYKHLNNEVFL